MLMNAFTLAVISMTAFGILFNKLPAKVKKFLKKHSLLTDATSLLLTYMLLGGTLTALMAAAMVGVMTSLLLYIANHEEDFLFLQDGIDMLKEVLENLRKLSQEWGAKYRAKKLEC